MYLHINEMKCLCVRVSVCGRLTGKSMANRTREALFDKTNRVPKAPDPHNFDFLFRYLMLKAFFLRIFFKFQSWAEILRQS